MKHRSLTPLLALVLGFVLCAAGPAARAATKHAAKQTIPATTDSEDEDPGPLGPVDPSKPPKVVAKSVIVINARTGDVLYEKDPDARRTIASTTKLMTAMLVAESGNLNQQVTVEPIDTICEPTKLSFHPASATPAPPCSTPCSSTVATTWPVPWRVTTPGASPPSPTA